MSNQNKNEHPLSSNIINYGFGLLVLFLLFIAGYIIYKYQIRLTDGLLPDYGSRDEWGALGDFFGGILNPIFGFLSFIALLLTIIYQAKELKLSRNELELSREELSKSAKALTAQNKAIELQSFEQTFFSWLNTYRDLLDAVTGKVYSNTLTARNYLYLKWESELSGEVIVQSMFEYPDFNGIYSIPKEKFADTYDIDFSRSSFYKKVEIISNKKPKESCDNILLIWCQLYEKDEYQLDSLFRTLYKLIIWIDSQQTERLNSAQKWLYISIVRSQLSWIEMTYLYYNGLTPLGSKFKPLIEKYALFDNLVIESDIGMKVLNRHLASESNYQSQAFDSKSAREKLGLPILSEDTLALATATLNNPFDAPSA